MFFVSAESEAITGAVHRHEGKFSRPARLERKRAINIQPFGVRVPCYTPASCREAIQRGDWNLPAASFYCSTDHSLRRPPKPLHSPASTSSCPPPSSPTFSQWSVAAGKKLCQELLSSRCSAQAQHPHSCRQSATPLPQILDSVESQPYPAQPLFINHRGCVGFSH